MARNAEEFAKFAAESGETSAMGYEAFAAMIREREAGEHTEEELQARFKALDTNASSKIEVDEYVAYSLKDALSRSSKKVTDLFREWDDDQSGKIDLGEFRKGIKALGFDTYEEAEFDALFKEMDVDHSGTIEYDELARGLKEDPAEVQKRALKRQQEEREKKASAMTKLVVTPDGTSVQDQVREILTAQFAKAMDLFKSWDEDKNGKVDKKEFRKAFAALGYSAPKPEIDAVFDSLDADGGGTITYKELRKTLKLGRSEQVKAKKSLVRRQSSSAGKERGGAALAVEKKQDARYRVSLGIVVATWEGAREASASQPYVTLELTPEAPSEEAIDISDEAASSRERKPALGKKQSTKRGLKGEKAEAAAEAAALMYCTLELKMQTSDGSMSMPVKIWVPGAEEASAAEKIQARIRGQQQRKTGITRKGSVGGSSKGLARQGTMSRKHSDLAQSKKLAAELDSGAGMSRRASQEEGYERPEEMQVADELTLSELKAAKSEVDHLQGYVEKQNEEMGKLRRDLESAHRQRNELKQHLAKTLEEDAGPKKLKGDPWMSQLDGLVMGGRVSAIKKEISNVHRLMAEQLTADTSYYAREERKWMQNALQKARQETMEADDQAKKYRKALAAQRREHTTKAELALSEARVAKDKARKNAAAAEIERWRLQQQEADKWRRSRAEGMARSVSKPVLTPEPTYPSGQRARMRGTDGGPNAVTREAFTRSQSLTKLPAAARRRTARSVGMVLSEETPLGRLYANTPQSAHKLVPFRMEAAMKEMENPAFTRLNQSLPALPPLPPISPGTKHNVATSYRSPTKSEIRKAEILADLDAPPLPPVSEAQPGGRQEGQPGSGVRMVGGVPLADLDADNEAEGGEAAAMVEGDGSGEALVDEQGAALGLAEGAALLIPEVA